MYDVIIIGAGPGGYIAAERAGAKGMKVLVIERGELGGVCLNEGCIPTKTLLNSAKRFEHARGSRQFGVHGEDVYFSMEEAQAWKAKVIETQRKGVAYLMKKYAVEIVSGEGRIVDRGRVAVGSQEYSAGKIIIATGSSPFIPPIPGAEGKQVLTSTEMLKLADVPESLTVIGGGVIGMEFASLCSMLGTEVHVVEMLDEIVPFMEPELAKMMRRGMKGITFHLGAKVTGIDGGTVSFERRGKEEQVTSDIILMAVGRKPNTEGLGLKELGIAVSKAGIAVNDMFQTSVPGIYAIGDVTGRSMFAHAASRMGEAVVAIIAGDMDSVNFEAVPWAVYTNPEAAGCGLTESQAAAEGYDVVTAKVQMRVNGRYLAEHGMGSGLCKVVADRESRELLGVHMVGGVCSEVIYGAAVCMQNGVTVDEIARSIFPHPSVSEVLRDAVMQLG